VNGFLTLADWPLGHLASSRPGRVSVSRNKQKRCLEMTSIHTHVNACPNMNTHTHTHPTSPPEFKVSAKVICFIEYSFRKNPDRIFWILFSKTSTLKGPFNEARIPLWPSHQVCTLAIPRKHPASIFMIEIAHTQHAHCASHIL